MYDVRLLRRMRSGKKWKTGQSGSNCSIFGGADLPGFARNGRTIRLSSLQRNAEVIRVLYSEAFLLAAGLQ